MLWISKNFQEKFMPFNVGMFLSGKISQKFPDDNKCYPKHMRKNKSAYRRWVKKYFYDQTKEILYRLTSASDGFGE